MLRIYKLTSFFLSFSSLPSSSSSFEKREGKKKEEEEEKKLGLRETSASESIDPRNSGRKKELTTKSRS